MATITKRFLNAINYRGTFATLAEIKALPEPLEGDWAKLDKGDGIPAKRLDYDAQDGWLPEAPSAKYRELLQFFDFNSPTAGMVFAAASNTNGSASTTVTDYAATGIFGYTSIGATVASGYYALRSTNAGFYPVTGINFALESLVSFSALGATGEDYVSRLGFMQSLNLANGGTDNVSFVYDRVNFGGNYQCECRSGSTTTRVDSGVAVSASAFQRLKIAVNGSGAVKFYIDGTLVATITTNIPSYANGGLYLALSHVRSATATTTKFTRVAFAKLAVLYTSDTANLIYASE
jgi:hypothetical protein